MLRTTIYLSVLAAMLSGVLVSPVAAQTFTTLNEPLTTDNYTDPFGISGGTIVGRRSQISIATGRRGFLEENLSGCPEAEARAGAVIE